MLKRFISLFFTTLMVFASHSALAFELKVHQVADDVYALVGPWDARSAENLALNANMGFVVTDDGVVLIDSGASPSGAALIERQIRQVTDKPVKWVINTGSQDHRWLGNGYFAQKGAAIIALQSTVAEQKQHLDNHLRRLERLLAEEDVAAIKPTHAADPVAGDRYTLNVGDCTIELRHFGDAHFPGDAVVWLPGRKVLFSGDLVYLDRLLGVQPWSDVKAWQQTYHDVFAAYDPEVVVPGHGEPAGMQKVKRQTGDYLDFLVEKVGAAVEEWEPLPDVMERYRSIPAFEQLKHYDNWHGTNLNRTYLQFEGS
ncbi:MAG: MBL fold metallo-hydrolase [Pseudomonadota bacterium]